MNLDIERLKQIGTDVDSILRLKTPSIGIVFCTEKTELPLEQFSVIDHPIPFCSLAGMSRFFELAVYISREQLEGQCIAVDHAIFGKKLPEGFAESITGVFTENKEYAAEIIGSMKQIDLPVTGIAIFPLKTAPVLPDVCQIWGNPLQITTVIYANTWTRPHVRLTNGEGSNGHGGSCYEGSVVPYLEKRINLATVDMGDRKHGHAGDEETLVAFPLSELERLYRGLAATQNTRHRLPVMYDFESSSFPVKKEYLERKGPNFA
jgi:uncharacterized protein (DUF169 family)